MSGASSRQSKYFTIGSVSKEIGLEPHVLRYWEKEFSEIRPRRISGRRLYRAIDVAYIKLIRHLLYKEGFTISGAKKRLKELKIKTIDDIEKYLSSQSLIQDRLDENKKPDLFKTLKEIKEELLDLIEFLD